MEALDSVEATGAVDVTIITMEGVVGYPTTGKVLFRRIRTAR